MYQRTDEDIVELDNDDVIVEKFDPKSDKFVYEHHSVSEEIESLLKIGVIIKTI